MDRSAYLDRIRYDGPLTATADTLRALQVAHLLSVPFENLSIHIGEPIVLDDAALFDKVVTRRRGGFCYELNGLFCWLLRDLGFDVTMVAAEVMNSRGDYGAPFDHMALIVKLEESWLVDVGFGESFVEPLRLMSGTRQVQGGKTYQIDEVGSRLVVQQGGDPEWKVMYRFDLVSRVFAEYEDMCRYHQTSPDSPFPQRQLCTLATANGRITLTGSRLITSEAGGRDERALLDERELASVLEGTFGIKLPARLPSAPR